MKDYSLVNLATYWRTFGQKIAQLRKWRRKRDKSGAWVCPTLQKYDHYMDKLGRYLSDKPICELVLWEIQRALYEVRNSRSKKPYSPGTMQGYVSCLIDIFRFAQDRGDAHNILAYFHVPRKGKIGRLDLYAPPAELRAQAEALLKESRDKPRSLNPRQQLILSREARRRIKEDGRSCGMAIMLYCGLRPSEVRGLDWEDLIPFWDDANLYYLRICDSRDARGQLQEGVKTVNAYRKIPVHPELLSMLLERRAYVEQHVGRDIGSYPICCMKNNFAYACKEHQLSNFGGEMFDGIRLTADDMTPFLAELLLEASERKLDRGDDHLTLYILRRNYWTMMEALTRLTDYEKRYLMGHAMHSDGRDLRESYNNEDTLCELGEKLGRYIIDPVWSDTTRVLEPGGEICERNRGILRVRISKEQILEHTRLHIAAIANTPGDAVEVSIRTSAGEKLRGLDLRKCERAIVSSLSPALNSEQIPINREYANWCAAMMADKLVRRESERKNRV